MDVKLTKSQLFDLLYEVMDMVYPNPKVYTKGDSGTVSVRFEDRKKLASKDIMMHWFPYEPRYKDYIFVGMEVYKQIRKYVPILSNDPNLGEFFLDYFSKICNTEFNVMYYDLLNADEIFRRGETITESDDEADIQIIKDLVDNVGMTDAIKYVGGIDKLIDVYGGFDEIKQDFFEKNGRYPVYISSDGMAMYIADFIIPIMNKERQVSNQIILKDKFRIKSSGMNYAFSVILVKVKLSGHNWNDGQYFWKVTGTTGSYGFGLSFISKRETFGKRARKQVFDQVIEKYNLKPFMK